MPHIRLGGYTPAHSLPALPVWGFRLHLTSLAFPPSALPHFVRARLRTVALIGLSQIDAVAFPAAGQGGGILRRHQVKIEQHHDIPDRALDTAKMPVRLPMPRISIGCIKVQLKRAVFAFDRTRAAGQGQRQFLAQFVLQCLEFDDRIQRGLGGGPEMQASRGQRAVQGQEQVRQLMPEDGQIPVPHGLRSTLAKFTSHCSRCRGVLIGFRLVFME